MCEHGKFKYGNVGWSRKEAVEEKEEEEQEVGECFRLFLNILQFSPSSLAYV